MSELASERAQAKAGRHLAAIAVFSFREHRVGEFRVVEITLSLSLPPRCVAPDGGHAIAGGSNWNTPPPSHLPQHSMIISLEIHKQLAKRLFSALHECGIAAKIMARMCLEGGAIGVQGRGVRVDTAGARLVMNECDRGRRSRQSEVHVEPHGADDQLTPSSK